VRDGHERTSRPDRVGFAPAGRTFVARGGGTRYNRRLPILAVVVRGGGWGFLRGAAGSAALICSIAASRWSWGESPRAPAGDDRLPPAPPIRRRPVGGRSPCSLASGPVPPLSGSLSGCPSGVWSSPPPRRLGALRRSGRRDCGWSPEFWSWGIASDCACSSANRRLIAASSRTASRAVPPSVEARHASYELMSSGMWPRASAVLARA